MRIISAIFQGLGISVDPGKISAISTQTFWMKICSLPPSLPHAGGMLMIPLGQPKQWAIILSIAFMEQSQTNGVAERFIRTLKGQVINGRGFQKLAEVIAPLGA